jgi:hypothetical protein
MARMWVKVPNMTAYRLDRAAYNLRLGYRDGEGREYTEPWIHPTTGEVVYEIETADSVTADLSVARQLLLKTRAEYEAAGFFPEPAPSPNNPATPKLVAFIQRNKWRVAGAVATAAAAGSALWFYL